MYLIVYLLAIEYITLSAKLGFPLLHIGGSMNDVFKNREEAEEPVKQAHLSF